MITLSRVVKETKYPEPRAKFVSQSAQSSTKHHNIMMMWNRGFQLSTQHSQHVTCTFQLQLISMEDNGTMTFCDQFNGSIKLKMEATVLYCTTEEHISTWMKWMFTRKIYKYPYILWKVKYCWYKPSCCDIRSNDKAFYQSFSFKSVVNIHGKENRRNNIKVGCDEIKVLDLNHFFIWCIFLGD